MSRHVTEAGELTESGEAVARAIETRLKTGRPLAAPERIADYEARMGRHLSPQRPGSKPKRLADDG